MRLSLYLGGNSMKKSLLFLTSITLLSGPIVSVTAQTNEEKLSEIKMQIESLQAEYDKLAGETSESKEAQSSTANEDSNKADWGKRSTPVPFGKPFELTLKEYAGDTTFDAKVSLTVKSVLRGEKAFEKITEFNRFNDPAPEGLEWVLIELELNYLEGNEDTPLRTPGYFKVFDSKGKEVKQDAYASLSPEFSGVEIFPKVIHTGYYAITVPTGDDSLFVFDDFDQKYYFDLKQP